MKRKINKKLSLKKTTIVSFEKNSMRRIAGGAIDPGLSELYPCDSNATCVPTFCQTCPTFCTCRTACC